MGFGAIVANLIMFISVLIVATGVVSVIQNTVDDSTTSMRIESDRLSKEIQTHIEIIGTNYDNDTETLTVTALNTGKTILKTELINVFVDNSLIPRNDQNRTIRVEPTTEIKNPGLLDPNEVLEVQVFTVLDNESDHTITLADQYGTREDELFSI